MMRQLVTFSGRSNQKLYLLLCLTLVVATLHPVYSNDAIDPGADFNGYMEEMANQQRDEWVYQAKLKAHEKWRQNTWAGWFVRTVQSFAYHFNPFFEAVGDALRETRGYDDTPSSPTKVLIYVGVRMAVVLGFLATSYVGAKVIQLMIGGDYEVVEEVIIVHEHETEEEAAKARATTTRGKKQKSS